MLRRNRTKIYNEQIIVEWGGKYVEFIEKYYKKQNSWEYISLNPNITLGLISEYPEQNWNWRNISLNYGLTLDLIDKYEVLFVNLFYRNTEVL